MPRGGSRQVCDISFDLEHPIRGGITQQKEGRMKGLKVLSKGVEKKDIILSPCCKGAQVKL